MIYEEKLKKAGGARRMAVWRALGAARYALLSRRGWLLFQVRFGEIFLYSIGACNIIWLGRVGSLEHTPSAWGRHRLREQNIISKNILSKSMRAREQSLDSDG